MAEINTLKSGYSTGAHAASAFKVALELLATDNNTWNNVDITLPSGINVRLPIKEYFKTPYYNLVTVIKSDNDDIDVTKGCEIRCFITIDIAHITSKISAINHQPYTFNHKDRTLQIFAGKGLGIITKEGLNAPSGYPAINKASLKMLEDIYIDIINRYLLIFKSFKTTYVVFEIPNGEEIAKQTANSRVGVIGGISFLGTQGIVKPVSNKAYLDSIKTEINVAETNNCNTLILTMGNSALNYAKEYLVNQENCCIEIANFAYDTIKLLSGRTIKSISVVANIAKLTKIAQRYMNTHNTYGNIDFLKIEQWLEEADMPSVIRSQCCKVLTMSNLEKFILLNHPDLLNTFYEIIANKALIVLKEWATELNSPDLVISVIMTDGNTLKTKIEIA